MKMDLKCCVERASIDEAYIDITEEVDYRLLNGFKANTSLMPNTVIAEYDSGVIDEEDDDFCGENNLNVENPFNDSTTSDNISNNNNQSHGNDKISTKHQNESVQQKQDAQKQKQLNNTTKWLQHHADRYNIRLAIGACIVEEMRKSVYTNTAFRCSAGVSHNKVAQCSMYMYYVFRHLKISFMFWKL